MLDFSNTFGKILLKHTLQDILELIILPLLLLGGGGRRSNAAGLGRLILKMFGHKPNVVIEFLLALDTLIG